MAVKKLGFLLMAMLVLSGVAAWPWHRHPKLVAKPRSGTGDVADNGATAEDGQGKTPGNDEADALDNEDTGRTVVGDGSPDNEDRGRTVVGEDSLDNEDRGRTVVGEDSLDNEDRGRTVVGDDSLDNEDRGRTVVGEDSLDNEDRGRTVVGEDSLDNEDRGRTVVGEDSLDNEDRGRTVVGEDSLDNEDRGRTVVGDDSLDNEDRGRTAEDADDDDIDNEAGDETDSNDDIDSSDNNNNEEATTAGSNDLDSGLDALDENKETGDDAEEVDTTEEVGVDVVIAVPGCLSDSPGGNQWGDGDADDAVETGNEVNQDFLNFIGGWDASNQDEARPDSVDYWSEVDVIVVWPAGGGVRGGWSAGDPGIEEWSPEGPRDGGLWQPIQPLPYYWR